jgi:hypothetical protein
LAGFIITIPVRITVVNIMLIIEGNINVDVVAYV